MGAYLFDWLSLAVRWLHFIAGIAWIGSSFYFVWLDNHLLPPADPAHARKGVGGELWSVHGGGFYHAQKYRVAPEVLPKTLHWFYWEAYSTFLSGFLLLVLLYYWQAEIYLIDPAVASLSKPAAIGIGLAFIVGGWFVYDGLCKTRAGEQWPRVGCRAGGAVLCGGMGNVPAVQRARRVHRVRRHAGHDHGRERVLRDHSGSARNGAREAGEPGARSRGRACAASCAPRTTPISRCPCCSR